MSDTAPTPIRTDLAQAEVQAQLEEFDVEGPLIGIVMGSESDMEAMEKAAKELHTRGIPHEIQVMSAHREADTVAEYAKGAKSRGLRVVIAGAGISAALPGAVAAHTDLPVIGVPLSGRLTAAGGLDAILSIVQMPPGCAGGMRGLGQRTQRGDPGRADHRGVDPARGPPSVPLRSRRASALRRDPIWMSSHQTLDGISQHAPVAARSRRLRADKRNKPRMTATIDEALCGYRAEVLDVVGHDRALLACRRVEYLAIGSLHQIRTLSTLLRRPNPRSRKTRAISCDSCSSSSAFTRRALAYPPPRQHNPLPFGLVESDLRVDLVAIVAVVGDRRLNETRRNLQVSGRTLWIVVVIANRLLSPATHRAHDQPAPLCGRSGPSAKRIRRMVLATQALVDIALREGPRSKAGSLRLPASRSLTPGRSLSVK